ncbi:MAG TPA: metal-dependent hydrolase [Candidatus Competibacteraceae bacterium]|nr:MAG: metal-dependent hydrolase [Candidatus Competibacteraceae bacterium]HOB63022.1 metal-dependent hydrolase [Candidatus Competibacteraceae bacterium]HQA26523.1 metal-dependent hydrolase [Candidatus Competibacteraceae bacterium]HQD57233.1 metal-dependent hydrolase [Candidatus Competibacteraceae bacterium]
MADFKTHLIGAAAVSGLAATVLVMTGQFPHQAVIGYFMLGTIGGLLPDIDSPTSIPIRIALMVMAVVAGFLVVFTFGARYSLVELIVLWLGCFLLIRYGLLNLFDRATAHRGLVHSIPAAVGFGLITVLIAYHAFGSSITHAWLCGSFVTLGFIVHLLLDEFYSVDLSGKKLLKSSFGTALSLGSLNQPIGTAALYLAVVGLFFLCPSPRPFTELVLNHATYRGVVQRLLPGDTWFPGLLRRVTPASLIDPR